MIYGNRNLMFNFYVNVKLQLGIRKLNHSRSYYLGEVIKKAMALSDFSK